MNTAPIRSWLEQDALFSQVVTWLRNQPAEVWIVGGTVRDALLGRPSDDLDLAVAGGALDLGRSLAAVLGGAFYTLDHTRDVGRVLVGKTGRHIDLAGLRAAGIDTDLCSRDFTINAMAISVRELDKLIDPTGGLSDLLLRVIRATNLLTFEDDPLRILRAFRLHNALGFTLDAHTVELLQVALPRLAQVAMERVRDELWLILSQENAAESLNYLQGLGGLPCILTFLGIPPETTRALESLKLFEAWLNKEGDWGSLAPWRPRVEEQWSAIMAAGRSRRVLLKLAALLACVPQPADAAQVGRNLCLSTRECLYLQHTLSACREVPSLTDLDTPLGVFCYYQRFAEAGLDGAVLVLAALNLPVQCQRTVGVLLSAWFTRYHEWVDPPVLLTGDDLMCELHVAAGPQIGRLLELLRRAQVQGFVHTCAEALAYLTGYLSPLE